MTDDNRQDRERRWRATSQRRLKTARGRLNSAAFVPVPALSDACEVTAARDAAMALIDALANLSPDDPETAEVTSALQATLQVLATHAGAASDWAPSGWWYEAKEKTVAALDAFAAARRKREGEG